MAGDHVKEQTMQLQLKLKAFFSAAIDIPKTHWITLLIEELSLFLTSCIFNF